MQNDDTLDPSALDEQAVPLDPLIALLHLRHTYTSPYSSATEKAAAKDRILEDLFAYNMRPYYQMLCDVLGWQYDQGRANEMDVANQKKLEELDAKIVDATENFGDVEVREALLAKCDFFARIGDADACITFNQECSKKTLAAGPKLASSVFESALHSETTTLLRKDYKMHIVS